MRGKGKRPSRLSTSPYARNRSGSRASSAASQSESGPSTARVTAPAVASGGNGEQGPLSADQLEAVVEQVSARVAPQLVEAVHQAIEPVHVTPQPEGVIALITLTVHIYSTRGLSQKDERKLKTLMLMGCFFQLMGVCGFTVYLTLAIVSNQGLQIYDDGYYLTLVWCFMTWKWGFSLFYYSRTYRRSLGITTLINQ